MVWSFRSFDYSYRIRRAGGGFGFLLVSVTCTFQLAPPLARLIRSASQFLTNRRPMMAVPLPASPRPARHLALTRCLKHSNRIAAACCVAAFLDGGGSELYVVDAFSLHRANTYRYPKRVRILDTSSTRTSNPHTHALKKPHYYSPQLFSKSKSSNRSSDTTDAASETSNNNDGSILGASLLFAGTAIGAGMLALPAETLDAGFIPSIAGLCLCWAFTYVTSIVTLEASWLAVELSSDDNGAGGGGFLSISSRALGPPGEVVTALLFWFLLTSIVVAYTSEGGMLISQFANEVSTSTLSIAPAVGSLIFATFFGSLASVGTSRVDFINRLFVLGFLGSFLGLVAFGLPQVDSANLINHADWSAVYPAGISIGILSFGAQNVVPTLLKYLGGDPNRTRRAILFGSLTPLVLYSIWEAVFLGMVSADSVAADGESKMQVVTVLGETGGTFVKDLVEVFSACAIGSSMAGASVSLVDFFQDAIGIFSSSREEEEDLTTKKIAEKQPSTADIIPGTGSSRLLAAVLALGPPVILAYAFPDIFLVALEEAGLLGGVSLYGVLPALSLLSLRRSSRDAAMNGRLGGGDVALYALVGISSGLVLPEIVRLGTMLVQ